MENNTKIAIGLAAAVVVGYIVYKSKKPPVSSGSSTFNYKDSINPNDLTCVERCTDYRDNPCVQKVYDCVSNKTSLKYTNFPNSNEFITNTNEFIYVYDMNGKFLRESIIDKNVF
jgi:hypothetical protein